MGAYTEVNGHQPDLQKMTKGYPVNNLQQLLFKHCFGPVEDGYFGDETERCLNDFKVANGLSADSIVDQATWAVLNGPPQWVARFSGTPSVSGLPLARLNTSAALLPLVPFILLGLVVWSFLKRPAVAA